eukprot:UN09414
MRSKNSEMTHLQTAVRFCVTTTLASETLLKVPSNVYLNLGLHLFHPCF